MANLVKAINDEDNTNAIIKSLLIHHEFERIHPFSDGNGRMGRLWQTLILSEWKPLFRYLPVESMVYANQREYYEALNKSTEMSDSAPFIEFMLGRILEACVSTNPKITPQDSPHVTPQVKQLLGVMQDDMSREDLQRVLGLKDRKSFRQRYLLPALEQGLIEMTIPDKPSSSLQKYHLTEKGLIFKNQKDSS